MNSSEDEVGDEEGKIIQKNNKSEHALKLVLLGDSCVGKTSICSRLSQHSFPQKYIQTSGLDFYSRRVQLRKQNSILLQLWDVAGHSLSSPSTLNNYIFGAHGVLFVYDVTNSQSFDNLNDWLLAANKLNKQLEKPFYMALIGNKADSEHCRSIKPERHSEFSDQNGMQANFYLSAKNDDSIELTFRRIAAKILGNEFTRAEIEQNISNNASQHQTLTTNNDTNNNKDNKDKLAKEEENKTTKESETTTEHLKNKENQRSSTTCLLQ